MTSHGERVRAAGRALTRHEFFAAAILDKYASVRRRSERGSPLVFRKAERAKRAKAAQPSVVHVHLPPSAAAPRERVREKERIVEKVRVLEKERIVEKERVVVRHVFVVREADRIVREQRLLREAAVRTPIAADRGGPGEAQPAGGSADAGASRPQAKASLGGSRAAAGGAGAPSAVGGGRAGALGRRQAAGAAQPPLEVRREPSGGGFDGLPPGAEPQAAEPLAAGSEPEPDAGEAAAENAALPASGSASASASVDAPAGRGAGNRSGPAAPRATAAAPWAAALRRSSAWPLTARRKEPERRAAARAASRAVPPLPRGASLRRAAFEGALIVHRRAPGRPAAEAAPPLAGTVRGRRFAAESGAPLAGGSRQRGDRLSAGIPLAQAGSRPVAAEAPHSQTGHREPVRGRAEAGPRPAAAGAEDGRRAGVQPDGEFEHPARDDGALPFAAADGSEGGGFSTPYISSNGSASVGGAKPQPGGPSPAAPGSGHAVRPAGPGAADSAAASATDSVAFPAENGFAGPPAESEPPVSAAFSASSAQSADSGTEAPASGGEEERPTDGAEPSGRDEREEKRGGGTEQAPLAFAAADDEFVPQQGEAAGELAQTGRGTWVRATGPRPGGGLPSVYWLLSAKDLAAQPTRVVTVPSPLRLVDRLTRRGGGIGLSAAGAPRPDGMNGRERGAAESASPTRSAGTNAPAGGGAPGGGMRTGDVAAGMSANRGTRSEEPRASGAIGGGGIRATGGIVGEARADGGMAGETPAHGVGPAGARSGIGGSGEPQTGGAAGGVQADGGGVAGARSGSIGSAESQTGGGAGGGVRADGVGPAGTRFGKYWER